MEMFNVISAINAHHDESGTKIARFAADIKSERADVPQAFPEQATEQAPEQAHVSTATKALTVWNALAGSIPPGRRFQDRQGAPDGPATRPSPWSGHT